MNFRELEKLLKADGWYCHDICGSHYRYKNHTKPGAK
ncbi:MAG: type II toxin-antitoxin system HicA family toxin [Phascolarctobacterium sp.]|nr:type II toxin-antitoxin system HicA family toxin [Phascolarctobacterium sp.]